MVPPRPDRRRVEPEDVFQREMGQTLGLGMQLAASVAVLTLLGHWLDGRIGTLPLFTVLGALLGFAGGTLSLVRRFPTSRGERRGEDSSDD